MTSAQTGTQPINEFPRMTPTPPESPSMNQSDITRISGEVQAASEPFRRLQREIHEVIVGQDQLLHRMIIGILANGHLLIEGVPGLAKTLAVSSLANGIDTSFQRLQFTPDLLPADVIGTLIYRPDSGEFVVNKGPVFANIVLADEINRAPAKVQSALLEAMQEHQVTIGKETHPLPQPFLVLATQNPLEQEGTYPLPEAQVDRFLMKVIVDYPTREEEHQILKRMSSTAPPKKISSVMSPQDILTARQLVDAIYVDDKIERYIVDLVYATREPGTIDRDLQSLVEYGGSPRASLALALCAKANAFLDGRGYVVPQDVKDLALDVLRHRVATTYEAEAEEKTSEDIVKTILDNVRVP
ncbi:MAG: MoxR family ATPase [Phycisphaerales bacterium]|nr:MoxR family ATPase [Phycisphaerales bacterium]